MVSNIVILLARLFLLDPSWITATPAVRRREVILLIPHRLFDVSWKSNKEIPLTCTVNGFFGTRWPWPLTYDLDLWTWPRYSSTWPPCQNSSLYVPSFFRDSETDTQTDRQTDTHTMPKLLHPPLTLGVKMSDISPWVSFHITISSSHEPCITQWFMDSHFPDQHPTGGGAK